MLLNPNDPLSEILTIPEAAALVDKKPATLRWWITKGYLTPMRIGRRTYVTERAVLDAERDVWQRTPQSVT